MLSNGNLIFVWQSAPSTDTNTKKVQLRIADVDTTCVYGCTDDSYKEYSSAATIGGRSGPIDFTNPCKTCADHAVTIWGNNKEKTMSTGSDLEYNPIVAALSNGDFVLSLSLIHI